MEDGQIITLTPEDIRIGQLKWIEIQRLHDLMHAAETDFGRWAQAMAALYGVPEGYQIGDPGIGFFPNSEGVAGD